MDTECWIWTASFNRMSTKKYGQITKGNDAGDFIQLVKPKGSIGEIYHVLYMNHGITGSKLWTIEELENEGIQWLTKKPEI